MSFLRHIGIFICRLYGDDILEYTTPVERWAEKNSKLCSADEIIAAAIVKSIAMNFDDWRYTSKAHEMNSNREYRTLTHTIRGVTVTVTWSENFQYNIQDTFKINQLSVSDSLGKDIRGAYIKIKEERARLKHVADKALADQKRLDEAWNLAESLLGMKRNAQGALVPVTVVEE